MGIRLLWQLAIVVIVTDNDCVVVYLVNKSPSLSADGRRSNLRLRPLRHLIENFTPIPIPAV